MLLMIDNYDSFTFNLVQYLGELGAPVQVVRNDEVTLGDIEVLAPTHLVFSPGPCSPAEAGICVEAIRHFMGRLPILGVCLGHQSIGAALGGRIVRAPEPKHGKTSVIQTDRKGLFAHLPRDITVIRYHSLVIEEASMPAELVVSARSEDGLVMAVRHRDLAGGSAPMEGVQFHPESILSEHGHAMLRNFLSMGANPLAQAARV
ncbi:MAG: anthranilate synthase component II [Betaproteobacteria bacterium]|jgi:anthranilate synthase component 2